VVKPVCEGSSVGVTVPKKGGELAKSIEDAFFWDPEVLVEEFIKGKEFMCVVWGNENPAAMLPTEVEFEGDIHTYESKYMPGRARYYTPIRASNQMVKKVQETAVGIYKLIGIKGYGRVDGYVVGENETIIKFGEVTSVEKQEEIPREFSLLQNYPNPFNPSTKIKFTIPTNVILSEAKNLVILKVYGVLGNDVATLFNEDLPGGEYEVEFNANGLTSGVYFYQLKAGSLIETKKMILIK